MTQEPLAERLRILRARKGLTLTEASKQIGITRHTLRSLELGGQAPHYPTLAKIARGYGIPVDELLVEEPALPLDEAPAPELGSIDIRRQWLEVDLQTRREELAAGAVEDDWRGTLDLNDADDRDKWARWTLYEKLHHLDSMAEAGILDGVRALLDGARPKLADSERLAVDLCAVLLDVLAFDIRAERTVVDRWLRGIEGDAKVYRAAEQWERRSA